MAQEADFSNLFREAYSEKANEIVKIIEETLDLPQHRNKTDAEKKELGLSLLRLGAEGIATNELGRQIKL